MRKIIKSTTLKITLNKKSILCLSGQNKKGADKQWKWKDLCKDKGICLANKDYVGGATCWSSNSLFNLCNCPIIFSIE